jgi:hypothetical protein
MSPSQYETSNIYLASFLLCQGATLLCFERVSARRVQFRFASDEKLHELLRVSWNSVPVTLVPAHLFAALRRLKKIVRRRPAKATPAAAPGSSPSSIPTRLC